MGKVGWLRLPVAGVLCIGWIIAGVAHARQDASYRPATVTMSWDSKQGLRQPVGGFEVSFEAFNPALGTLQQVTFDYSGILTTSLSARNNSTQPYSGELLVSSRLVVDGPGVSVDDPSRATFHVSSLWFGLMARQEIRDVPLSPAITFSMGPVRVNPLFHGSYEGDGVVGMRYNLVLGETLSPSRPWLSTGVDYRMSLTAGVTYHYLPVPEPGVSAVMAAGLGILVFAASRRSPLLTIKPSRDPNGGGTTEPNFDKRA